MTNHDVKAVEYFLKEKLEKLGLSQYTEFIHFGLTSQVRIGRLLSPPSEYSQPPLQDINNTAIPLALKEAVTVCYLPALRSDVMEPLAKIAHDWREVAMLAHTHGQPATPTRVGKVRPVSRAVIVGFAWDRLLRLVVFRRAPSSV